MACGRGQKGFDLTDDSTASTNYNDNARVGIGRAASRRFGGRGAHTNLNQPTIEQEETKRLLKGYIPGLHVPGENYPVLPTIRGPHLEPQVPISRNVAKELEKEFYSGEKNPISIIIEYCSKMQLDVKTEDTASDNSYRSFGLRFIIDGHKYPIGSGGNKKEAKTDAARKTFEIILSKGHCVAKDEDPANDSHDPQEVDALSMVHEICMRKNVPVKFDVAVVKDTCRTLFECNVYLACSRDPLCTKTGSSENDATRAAAEEALKLVSYSHATQQELSSLTRRPETHFDKIANMVIKKAQELSNQFPFSYNRLAGFVVKKDPTDKGEVVAIGTGERVIGERLLKDAQGRVLVDLHAEVTARRAFIRYLYTQLADCTSGKDSIFKITTPTDMSRSQWSLKEDVSIHMYVSSPPCGDARCSDYCKNTMISDNEWKEMSESTHFPTIGSVDGMLKVKDVHSDSKADALKSLSLPKGGFEVMSCSDKILKWNVLGVQGCLLSDLIGFIFINSITIGDEFHFGHMARAICCRLENYPPSTPPITIHHPFIGRTSLYRSVTQRNHLSNVGSVNWSAADKLPEFIDQSKGIENENSPFKMGHKRSSRLCKMCLFYRYREASKHIQGGYHPQPTDTYLSVKKNSSYQKTKNVFLDMLKSQRLGSWVLKSQCLDNFVFEAKP